MRAHHAARVRSWIVGLASQELGITGRVATEVDKLLDPLGPSFRADLGLVCESHHLDDLHNFAKYKTSQPYGNSDAETANVHFSAILLRTVDLLHITSDRTPSIVFRTLNPFDPISQREWAKQMAVRSVRSQPARDDEGNVDPKLPRDTIEVHARFSNEEGFFGLTSYLDYAEKQLRLSHDWATLAQRRQGVPHLFPWRRIDQSFIETEGFLREQFEFTVDQAKILDLLTGHTLYNDTGVVLRELAQNAIDAVRLQFFDGERRHSAEHGRVQIDWDSSKRTLTVTDNGTGMTQEIIEKHLLKVGASRYQDPKFKEQHPHFNPISRFGIGILSAFMVADEVEIVTCHPDEEKARRLSLRSVHGKYLIRLVDKSADDLGRLLAPHGTRVRLTVRASAKVENVVDLARRWIVIPDCSVVVRMDNEPELTVGFKSTKEALQDALLRSGLLGEQASEHGERTNVIKVMEEERDGVSVAYALAWSDWFREWSFLSAVREDDLSSALGTCVEGIRVDLSTPGFDGQGVWALANATGSQAPRTNVARSGLEKTSETLAMLRSIYAVYFSHVSQETEDLQRQRSFSLTWAVGEARYILDGLERPERYGSAELLDQATFAAELAKLALLIVEHGGERRAVSAEHLAGELDYWTVDCAFFRSVENMLREVPGNASLQATATALGVGPTARPEAVLLCNPDALVWRGQMLGGSREVVEVAIEREQRRIDLRWRTQKSSSLWVEPEKLWPRTLEEWNRRLEDRLRRPLSESRQIRWRRTTPLRIPKGDVKVSGAAGEIAVQALNTIFILPGSALSDFLLSCAHEAEADRQRVDAFCTLTVFVLYALQVGTSEAIALLEDEFIPGTRGEVSFKGSADLDQLHQIIVKGPWVVFSTSAWERFAD